MKDISTLEKFFFNKSAVNVDQPSDDAQWASSFSNELRQIRENGGQGVGVEKRIDELELIAKKRFGYTEELIQK